MTNEINAQNYDNSKHDYPRFLVAIKDNFNAIVGSGVSLFTTDVQEDLFEVFLNNIEEEARGHYTCRECAKFVNRFGGLVAIKEKGKVIPVMWDDKNVPSYFANAVKELKKVVSKATVTGVFLSSEKTLGQPKTGKWHHMNVSLAKDMIFKDVVKTADQKMAQRLEDFKDLLRSLGDYSIETTNTALEILNSDILYRSDKVLGAAQWFKKVQEEFESVKVVKAKKNVVWKAVATAPVKYPQVRSSMIGTLLDDIEEGLDFASISTRFKSKMSTYMIAQSAPSDGNVQQAEKLVKQLGIENSLIREYAKIEDIPEFVWKDKKHEAKVPKKESSGIFGNIVTKQKVQVQPSLQMTMPTNTMTWKKFEETVLGSAEKVEVFIDNDNRLMAIVNAYDKESPNILQWDNSFSWYYHGGIDGEMKKRIENAGGRYSNNEIRCSLIWDGYTDLDLHCITPNGSHLYWQSKKDFRSGGHLDIDANGIDGKTLTPVENVRWADNAPEGNYRFYVDNFSQDGPGETSFKVELEINGTIYTKTGSLRHKGKVDVFNFRYYKGQQPNIQSEGVSSSQDWNIPLNAFVEVKGIVNSPNMWGDKKVTNAGHHIFFLVDGCKDLSEGKGRGFFVESLKPEFHEIRKTLQAYTANTPIYGVEEASACGVGHSKDSEWNMLVRVKTNNTTRIIKIDRWD